MHWSEEIAARIIAKNPDKKEYVCAAGISPSGSVHIGNFRDIATAFFVCNALKKAGKKAKLLFSWDEFDRLRKVPKNVAEIRDDFEQYIGMPYVDVPDPFGCHESYAAHFEAEFERSLKKFGIEIDFRRQAHEYRSGRYADKVIHALKHRKEIFDILDSFRTQDATEDERENYYPAGIYCPVCHKDTTHITHLSDDCTEADYECACGHKGHFNFTTDFNCKLAWKIDWPMRWQAEGVDFEPGGKDHASPNGSYQTSRIIADKIFGYTAPEFQGYEFIGIKGATGKMSGSSGLNLTPEALFRIYQPEVILWLYSKSDPLKAFDFCFDDGILRQYGEFDKMYAAVKDGSADDYVKGIMYNCMIEGRDLELVPMSQLASLGSIVDWNPDMVATIFDKIGTPFTTAQFAERLELAKYWAEQCAPENLNRLLTKRNWNYYMALTEQEKREIAVLHEFLANNRGYSLDDLNTFIYAVPVQVRGEMEGKEKKAAQGEFFKNVYQLLLGKERGPRLYLFLYSIDVQSYIDLLDFSGEPEIEPVAEETAAEAVEPETEPDEIPEMRDEITLDDWEKMDLRVVKVINCEEIKKSRNLLRLELDDGMGGREIVTNIRGIYTPEQLIGRKIIIIANLAPHKFSGVLSRGMLLAASNGSCGTKVVFVDDDIPAGTRI